MSLGDDGSGLSRARRLMTDGAGSPMWATFGQRVLDVGEGWSVVEGTPKADFNNHMGRTHGGFAATLIDTAMGVAVMTKVPDGTGYGTISMTVNFVRKIDTDLGALLCKAKVEHAGRTMLTAEASIVDSTGKLYAHGMGSFLVYPKQ